MKQTNKFLKIRPTSILAAAIASTVIQTSYAQQENWYQVELIVFSQTLDASDIQEDWPKNLVLAYPPGSVHLTEPGADDQEGNQTPPEHALDADPLNDSTEANNNDETDASAVILDEAIEPEQTEPVHTPFESLPKDEFSLSAVKFTLDENSRYRVLSHVAWRQPGYDKEQQKAVILTGGDRYDNHYELEGTVTLRLSRYLHLESNLWFTQFYPNYGEASGFTEWPPLPELPVLASANNSEKAETNDAELSDQLPTSALLSNSVNPANSDFSFELDSDTSHSPSYIVDRIIMNTQSRRMRSGEIHYLDHPILGIIVQVTPWQPEVSTSESDPLISAN